MSPCPPKTDKEKISDLREIILGLLPVCFHCGRRTANYIVDCGPFCDEQCYKEYEGDDPDGLEIETDENAKKALDYLKELDDAEINHKQIGPDPGSSVQGDQTEGNHEGGKLL